METAAFLIRKKGLDAETLLILRIDTLNRKALANQS
jgi:hypothetical protein